jgi:Family of unknown function (DUF6496)
MTASTQASELPKLQKLHRRFSCLLLTTLEPAIASQSSEVSNMPAAKKASKKSSRKSAGRKYSPSASKSVEREMKEMKQGKLRSGRSGKKVTNPKQAIAIGLSEARKKGAKVPAAPKKSSAKKSGAKKSGAKKSGSRKS